MDRFVKLNRQGLTLVEVMIALLVMLVVFFALMQTALVGIDANMLNTLRGEAVNAAEKRMNADVRNKPFASILTDTDSLLSVPLESGCGVSSGGCNDCPTGFPSTGKCRCSDVRSISDFKFCTNVTCTELGGDNNCATDDADNRRIDVMVGWKWKGQNYVHKITTVRKR
jgi:prepilin-type N-terminal cleavage/methylation domain-containing protein